MTYFLRDVTDFAGRITTPLNMSSQYFEAGARTNHGTTIYERVMASKFCPVPSTVLRKSTRAVDLIRTSADNFFYFSVTNYGPYSY